MSKTNMNPLADFYGMAGMPRIAKEETGTTHLANGFDLTRFGLNLATTAPLYPEFASVTTEGPSKIHKSSMLQGIDPSFFVKSDSFFVEDSIKTNQPRIDETYLDNFNEQTLLYIFYAFPGSAMQQQAFKSLKKRNYQYQTTLKIWYGEKQFFNVKKWSWQPWDTTHVNTPTAVFPTPQQPSSPIMNKIPPQNAFMHYDGVGEYR